MYFELLSPGCIPTCVGQTKVLNYELSHEGVYPHLRGADTWERNPAPLKVGVSPPAWGRRNKVAEAWYLDRCIPTCVGQTVPPNLRLQDSPGVSPPAWGRRYRPIHRRVPARCIPTCVGQTSMQALEHRPMRVYPHLRGADCGCQNLRRRL